jgi:hypothetical protein
MSKGDACFYCLNCIASKPDKVGWIHDCKLGIDNTGFDDREIIAEQCNSFQPRDGFQMGGYYTHMYFEREGNEVNPCLNWVIQGDLNFPIPDGEQERQPIKIHICDFHQIEEWVQLWGIELRKRGWINDEEE